MDLVCRKAALFAALVLGGCGAPVERPADALALPAQWEARAPASGQAPDAEWWRGFGSAELAELVQAAQAGSFDVAAAAARVSQADALARIAGAALLPEVGGSASAARAKTEGLPSRASYAAGLSASYELDIWGANRAARQAALATLDATAYARDAVMLTLTASVAASYMQTLAARERTAIARRSLAAGEQVLGLVESRHRAGAATALELAQQRSLVASLRQAVSLREQQARDSLTALAILIGRAPQGFGVGGASLAVLAAPMADAGVPADLLARRPDIAQAERQLAAADADVAVARAAMLPSVTLTASAGFGNDRLRGLLDNPLYNLAAGLSAPIFSAGRLAASRDLALARSEELLAAYRQAILAALGDVEVALNAADSLARQRLSQDEALAQAGEAVRLAESRYRAGAETLLALLDAQRTLYGAQDEAVQLRLAQLYASLDLYKALGGGWKGGLSR